MSNAHEQNAQLNIPAFLLNPIASRVEVRGTRPTEAPTAEELDAAVPDELDAAIPGEPDAAVPEEPEAASPEEPAEVPQEEPSEEAQSASEEKPAEERPRRRRAMPEPGSVRVLKPEPEPEREPNQEPAPEQDILAESQADAADAEDDDAAVEPEDATADQDEATIEDDESAEDEDAQLELAVGVPEGTEAAADEPEETPATKTPSREDEVDAMMQSVLQAVHGTREDDEPAEPAESDAEDAPTLLAHALALASIPQIEEEDEPGQDNAIAEPEPQELAEPKATPFPAPEPKPEPSVTPAPKDEESEEPEPDAPIEDDAPVPTLEEDLETMRRIERRLFAHRYASTELDAFGSSIDPRKATADRSEALAVLAEEDHELLSAPGVGEALDRLCKRANELEPLVATQAKVLAKDRWHIVSAPASLRSELVRLTAESYDVWVRARREDDWQSFAPYLDRIVDIKKQMALAQDPDAHPYDTLLDEYEPGTNRAFYNSFFARVKHSVVPLLSSISMSNRNMSRACVEGHFDERRQWDLAEDICEIMGIDEDAHYLTSTVHPYSEAMTSNYVVTASHIVGDDLMSNVYTMLHELGHNLYEQGVDPKFNRTSLKGGTSSGMHEAQSRFFENCVGRDRAFMGPLLELMRFRYPGQLSRVTPNQLYRAVNIVAPSLIRVEADEVSYPLHILVRYEIECLLFDGKATARDVPKLWAERYENYIGIRPTNDADGALQDVHWAMGDFGYFPAYALGNAYAAQLRAKMLEEGMDWNALLRAGNLAPIRAWLKDRIWQYGRSKKPRQLIQEACGEPFSPRHYANYLTDKFTALYGLGRN